MSSVESFFEWVSAQDLALFTRQFATLAAAGLPLVECLSTLIEQIEHTRSQANVPHAPHSTMSHHAWIKKEDSPSKIWVASGSVWPVFRKIRVTSGTTYASRNPTITIATTMI